MNLLEGKYMMKQKTILGVILAAVTLIGCQASYRSILDQKLTNKSPEEKRVILNQECKDVLEKHKKSANETSAQHVERMQKICQEMTGHKKQVKKEVKNQLVNQKARKNEKM